LSLCLTNYALRHEDVWGSGCIDPHFLDLGTSWRWVVSFTALPLYPRYPFYRRLDGPQSRSGRYGEVKIFYPTGTRTPTPSIVQPVASRYTDWAIPAPRGKQENEENGVVLSFITWTFHIYLWLLNEAVSCSDSYKDSCLNLMVEWSAFLPRTEQVPCSNICWEFSCVARCP
jgi:hypothetical protein